MQPPQREPTLKPLMQVIPVNAPSASSADAAMPARRWSVDAIEALYALPLNDLIHRAQLVHREHFDPNAVQLSTLLSIKTGGCPEDCGYCPQAARYHTGIDNEALLSVEDVVNHDGGLLPVRSVLAAGWAAATRAMVEVDGALLLLVDPATLIAGFTAPVDAGH